MEPEGLVPHSQCPLFTVLRHINTLHTIPRFFNIHFNIMLPLILSSSRTTLPFSTWQKCCTFINIPIHATCFAYFILLYLITLIIFGQVMKLIIMQLSPASCHFLSVRLKCCSRTPSASLGSTLNITDQVSHSYKTTVNFDLFVFRQQTGSQIIKWTVAGIPCI